MPSTSARKAGPWASAPRAQLSPEPPSCRAAAAALLYCQVPEVEAAACAAITAVGSESTSTARAVGLQGRVVGWLGGWSVQRQLWVAEAGVRALLAAVAAGHHIFSPLLLCAASPGLPTHRGQVEEAVGCGGPSWSVQRRLVGQLLEEGGAGLAACLSHLQRDDAHEAKAGALASERGGSPRCAGEAPVLLVVSGC